MHVDGIGAEEDDIVGNHALDEVLYREDEIAVDVARFADTHGGAGAHQRGFFAAGHIFVEEMHELLGNALLAGSGAALAETLPEDSPTEEPIDLALERLNRFADMVNEQKESSLGFLWSLKDSAA